MLVNAKDIMCPNITTCTGQTLIKQAAQLMAQEDCGSLPVIDGSLPKPVGIITDRDIVCRAVANGLDPETTPVSACMTTSPVCVDRDTSIDECISLLADKQIRRLIVIDQYGACCGIIAQADIARAVSPAISGNVLRRVSEPPLALA